MTDVGSLAEFRTRPFELLQEFERRCRLASLGGRGDVAVQEEWVGVGFVVGNLMLVAPREDIKEILTFPTLTRVPGAKGWLQGLANVRGQLLPVIDLRHFAGAGETPVNRNSRVIVVNHPEIPAGFLVDEVRGFRRFQPSERVDEKPPVETHFAPFLTGSFRRGEEIWGVLNLHGLVESSSFLQAAE